MAIDPHANAGYVLAAYCITALILGGYAFRLWRRSRGG